MQAQVEAVGDAAERLLEALHVIDDVSYSETGGTVHRVIDGVGTLDGVRQLSSFDQSGAWCRPFVEGRADYRWTSSLDEAELVDTAERAVRAARHLAQTQAASVDSSIHRASHAGWSDTREQIGVHPTDAATRLDTALQPARDTNAVERAHLSLSGAAIDSIMMTSTGSVVRTHRNRLNATLSLTGPDRTKITRHHGSTIPIEFWNQLETVVDAATDDMDRLVDYDTISWTDVPQERPTVLLAPRAAGQFIHILSHYFEADTQLAGLSPYTVGDRIAVEGLTVKDTIPPGSWAALAYDAECRPTTGQTLVRDGQLVDALDDTASAVETGREPAGSVIPDLGYEAPPRIHVRHLDVDPGDQTGNSLRAESAVVIERFGDPVYEEDVEGTQRDGWMPASSLYARDIAEEIPENVTPGYVGLPIEEGIATDENRTARLLDDVALRMTPATPQRITALSAERETTTGTCEKHGTWIPFAVTAPAIQLEAELRPR